MDAKQYIKGILYSRKDVDNWLSGKSFPFAKYDPYVGYVHRDRRARDGTGDTVSTYHYDAKTGARAMLNNADVPCRISAYGDSFTHGDQVNDGETWEEMLAARIGEPIRNFGTGGYSICQIFRRMKQKEPKLKSELIILNIYDDDPYRSLVPLQQIRSQIGKFHFHPPIPYFTANPSRRQFIEHDNPASKPEDLYDYCDLGLTYEEFKDDFAVRIMLAKANVAAGEAQDSYRNMEDLAAEYGTTTKIRSPRELLSVANSLFTASATYASIRMVQGVTEFASKLGRKVLFVTSYGNSSVSSRLRGGKPMEIPERRRPGFSYNPQFAEFMEKSGFPWVDLAAAHAEDYSHSNLSIPEYLAKYFVYPQEFASHYNPTGNLFTAKAVEGKLKTVLEPKPPAYRYEGLTWDESKALVRVCPNRGTFRLPRASLPRLPGWQPCRGRLPCIRLRSPQVA